MFSGEGAEKLLTCPIPDNPEEEHVLKDLFFVLEMISEAKKQLFNLKCM